MRSSSPPFPKEGRTDTVSFRKGIGCEWKVHLSKMSDPMGTWGGESVHPTQQQRWREAIHMEPGPMGQEHVPVQIGNGDSM